MVTEAGDCATVIAARPDPDPGIAVISVPPLPVAVTSPVASTSATDESALDHSTVTDVIT